MPDLPEQLNAYIDGIADPVTEAEVTEGRLRRAATTRRWRVAVAIAAGAAAVLVPALVIAALRLFPAEDPIAAPPTSTASTTTTIPQETTIPAPVLVEVPDVVGMTAAEATDLLTAAGFAVEVSGDPDDLALVAAQNPAAGIALEAGAMVRIDVAPYVPACRKGWAPELPPPAPDEVDITVLFDCANQTDQPNVTTPVIRRVRDTVDPIRATLEALLSGPTTEERAGGLQSFFSEESAGALESLVVADGLAVVDFNDAIYVNNASTSAGSEFFLAELGANLLQFDEVDRIEFRVDGRCEAFWGWLQRECFVMTRNGLSDELPFGSCSAAGSSAPAEEQLAGLPEPVVRTTARLLSLAVRCDLGELDALAGDDDTSIVLTHLFLGDTPFTTAERELIGAPAAGLVETLAFPVDAYDEQDVTMYVWPSVAAPGFDWAGLSAGEIAELSARYGEAIVDFSIDNGVWSGLSIEIDETGRWRSFGQPLS